MSDLIAFFRGVCLIIIALVALYALFLVVHGNIYGQDVDLASKTLNATCFITPTLDNVCIKDNLTCQLGMSGLGEYWLYRCRS